MATLVPGASSLASSLIAGVKSGTFRGRREAAYKAMNIPQAIALTDWLERKESELDEERNC